jgi:hypothetical protein
MKRLTSVIAGLMFVGAGAANAAQPLTEAQMDSVSAGATAVANAGAVAAGVVTALSAAQTSTATVGNVLAHAQGQSTAIALTALPAIFGPAIAASASTSTATLP